MGRAGVSSDVCSWPTVAGRVAVVNRPDADYARTPLVIGQTGQRALATFK